MKQTKMDICSQQHTLASARFFSYPYRRVTPHTSVRIGTAWLPSGCNDVYMSHKKRKKADNATSASVKKEMAKPRIARSARIAELNLDTARIRARPSITLPGTVDGIIPPAVPSQPEKAQIAVGGADHGYRNFRIENTLTDEHGDDVRLTHGAHVDVTVTAQRNS
jgi:hypothetical protein